MLTTTKSRTLTVTCGIVAVAVVTAAATLYVGGGCRFPAAHIHPRDPASAREALLRSARRQGRDVLEDNIESISTSGTWLEGLWVFALRNVEQPLLGGPRFTDLFLIGPTVAAHGTGGMESPYVTQDFAAAFRLRLQVGPPSTAQEALSIATCYAWLATQTRPSALRVLKTNELPATLAKWLSQHDAEALASMRAQVIAPSVVAHRTVGTAGGHSFTVELCTCSPDFWGDIIFWHMEIGPQLFSVSRRPLYRAPRVME